MQQYAIIKNLVEPLVISGIYRDNAAAFRAIVLDYIERKRREYDATINSFAKKYGKSFEEFSGSLLNNAGIADEDDWMEWKGALEMRRRWDEAYRLSVQNETL